MKKILIPVWLFLISFVLFSCSEPPPPQTETKPAKQVQIPEKSFKLEEPICELTMGWDPWEPYQYLTPDNQVRGLEIDLISSMAKRANCSVRFVQNDWMNLLKGIQDGSIDLLGGASKTPAREKYALFSDNYRHESFILYIRSDDLSEYNNKTLIELLDTGFKLGVTEDYIYGDAVLDMQDNEKYSKQFVSVPITEVNYYNLVQNQIDGFLEDPFVANYTIRRKGLAGQIEASDIQVQSGDVSIMFSKASVKPELVEKFNQGLRAMKLSGEYQEILDKYTH